MTVMSTSMEKEMTNELKSLIVITSLSSMIMIPKVFAFSDIPLFTILHSESPFSEIEFIIIILIFTTIGVSWKIFRKYRE